MSKLNISKFKKVSSDKDFTIMKHPNGHEIKIAHKALSPKMRGELDGLPHLDAGGPTPAPKTSNSVPESDPVKTKQFTTGVNAGDVSLSDAWGNAKKALGFKDGGPIQTMAQLQASSQGKPDPTKKPDQSTTQSPPNADAQTDADAGEQQTEIAAYKKSHPGYTKGGDVSDDDKTIGQRINFPGSEPSPSPSPVNKADGGSAEDDGSSLVKLAPLLLAMAKGGNVKDPTQRHLLPGDKLPNAIEKKVISGTKRQMYADGTPEDTVSQEPVDPNAVATTGYNPAAPQQSLDIEPIDSNSTETQSDDTAQQSAQSDDTAQQSAQTAPPAQAEDTGETQEDSPIPQGSNQASTASTEAPTPQVPPTPADVKQTSMNEYQTEDQAWAHDLANQHITPKTYQDLFSKHADGSDRGPLSKIGMIFGLLVGGAGSGLTHQPNALLGMMNKQIDNDLEAQKQSKSNAQNYLRLAQKNELQKYQQGLLGAQTASTKQIMDINANAFARMQMNRAALQHMVEETQKGSPEQQQQSQAALAMMAQSVNNENYNIADRASAQKALLAYASGNTQGGPNAPQTVSPEDQFQTQQRMLRMSGNKDLAEDNETKHIPGFIGKASAPMTPDEKDDLTKFVGFDQQLGRYTDWAKQHSGILPDTPGNIAIINQGKTLARNLQSAYRENLLNTVYKAGEQPLLDQTIDSDPTKFLNKWRVIPQLDALRQENMSQLNTAAISKGFKGYQGSGQQPTPQYKMSGGQKYMRGPNGSAIPVK